MQSNKVERSDYHNNRDHKYILINTEHKYEYDRDSYCEFIDEIFMKDGYKMEKIEYKDYLSR